MLITCTLRDILIVIKNGLSLEKMVHILQNEFKKQNWLPISDRINQCVFSITFKFVNDISPTYLNEMFQWATECNGSLRNDCRKLKQPFTKTIAGQNSLSFLGPSKRNKLLKFMEKLSDTFKHKLKNFAYYILLTK